MFMKVFIQVNTLLTLLCVHGSCLRVCALLVCLACGDQKWPSDPETRVHMALCHHINAGNLTQTLWEIKPTEVLFKMKYGRRKEEGKNEACGMAQGCKCCPPNLMT